MDHLEFAELHNRLIEFQYRGETLTGVVIDSIPYDQKRKHTEYLFIPRENLLEWRNAEAHDQTERMKELSLVIDITEVEEGVAIPISIEDIERRVTDWKNRLNELYSDLNGWLSNDINYNIKISSDHRIYEGLMKEFGVKEQKLPSADIFSDKVLIMTFKPIGLWTFGANGRIDILTAKGNYILVDLAIKYRRSDWKIYLSNDATQFNKDVFLKLLKL